MPDLIINRIDGFGAAEDLELKSLLLQDLLQRIDKIFDEALPFRLCFPELIGYIGIPFLVGVFETKVFQLRFDGVKAQAMGQWRIEIKRFAGDLHLLVALHVLQRAHIVQAVGQFDQDHTYVLGEC